MTRLSRLVQYVLIVGAIQLAIALWVPIRISVVDAYLRVTLVHAIQPRALIGTIVQSLGLDNRQFLIATQAALFVWLLTLALLIATPRGKRMPDPADWRKCALLFLFAFSTLPFITNAFSGLVDIFAAAALIVCVWLLFEWDRSSWTALLGVVLLMCAATLIHDKSVFEAAILLVWIAYARSRHQAIAVAAGYALFLGGYLWLTSGQQAVSSELTLPQYLGSIAQFRSYLEENSFNVAGVMIGGGVLWALYAWLAVLFVRRSAKGRRLLSVAVVLVMVVLSLAPLLLAWDTNRLVAIVWLPALLLLLETNWPAVSERSRAWSVVLVAACVLQALIPPVFIYRHGAVALNCYATFAVQELEQAQESPSWPLRRGYDPLTLRLLTDRPDVSRLYGCAPVHLTRPGRSVSN